MAHHPMAPLNRRGFLLAAAAASVAASLPRTALAAGPTILVLGGSSMTGALGKALDAELKQGGYRPYRRAKGSTGLARPDFFDWIEEGKKLYASQRPAGTIVMFGGNDGQGLWMGKNAQEQWIRYGQEGWDAEYRQRIRAMSKAVCQNGEHIFWMGMPIMRSPKLRRRVAHMNELFAGEMASFPNGHYIDNWSLLADRNGEFTELKKVDGKTRRIRAQDGVHLGIAGAELMARNTLPSVQSKIATS